MLLTSLFSFLPVEYCLFTQHISQYCITVCMTLLLKRKTLGLFKTKIELGAIMDSSNDTIVFS